MATKNHVDNSVAERRLRPIYDWLDCGNNKKALQEADKLLKKQPNFQCAKVLKGLALLRLGKEKESEDLISAVHAEVPFSDATLQAMTICYREMHKPEMICDLFAAAITKDPANEELLTHLFMAYVRVGDYQKQQRTAMALYKLAPKNPYYFWAVMSVVMQAHTSNAELKRSVVLPLAERMVKKIVEEDKIEAEQEVQLYIMILEMQGKLEESLKVLEGPLGDKLQSCVTLPAKRVQLLIKLKRWSQANVMLKQLLKEDLDCWSHYKDYLDSVFNLIDSNDSGDKGDEYLKDADKTIADCAGFLSGLQEDNQRLTHRLRGPYLAHLEFYARVTRRGDKTDVHLGDLVELFMLYFHEFGSKQCCLSDLKLYLPLMSAEQVKDFLDQVFKLVQLAEGQLPSTLQQTLRYITNLQMSRFLGFHEALDRESKLNLATCLMQYYKHGIQFNEGLLPTDFGHSDTYAVLVAHLLYDTYIDTDDLVYLKEAILVLESALSHSVSNYQLKLLLLKFYNLLGACKAGFRYFELLDIKHMQLDTLGYFQLWPLLSTAQFMIAFQVFNTTLKFFTASFREGSDHLTISYKYGSFLKISEFVEFRDRLNNSMHYAAVQVEKALMDVLHSTSHEHAAQMVAQTTMTSYFRMAWNNLEDNRDFTTVWSANPTARRMTDELIKVSYNTEVDLLRFRMLLLQILMCSINFDNEYKEQSKKTGSLSNGEGKENSGNCINNIEELKNLIDELMRLYERLLATPHAVLPKGIIEGPPDSRLPDYINSLLVPVIYSMFIIINGIYCRKGSSNENCNEDNKFVNGCQQNYKGNSNDLSSCSPNNDYIVEDSWRDTDVNDYSIAAKIVSSMVLNATNKLLVKIQEITKLDSLSNRLEVIKEITLMVEVVCFVTSLCGVVHSFVKHIVKTAPVKKGKKKKSVGGSRGSEVNELTEDHKKQIETVEFLITKTRNVVELLGTPINNLETVWLVDTISNEISALNLVDVSSSTLNKRISDSYVNSLREVSSVLRRKLRYLNELKL